VEHIESNDKRHHRPTHLDARTSERLVQADQTEEERRRELELHDARSRFGVLGL
jgi:hypothetical protein